MGGETREFKLNVKTKDRFSNQWEEALSEKKLIIKFKNKFIVFSNPPENPEAPTNGDGSTPEGKKTFWKKKGFYIPVLIILLVGVPVLFFYALTSKTADKNPEKKERLADEDRDVEDQRPVTEREVAN